MSTPSIMATTTATLPTPTSRFSEASRFSTCLYTSRVKMVAMLLALPASEATTAALFATIGGFLLSVLLKFLPAYADLSFLSPLGFAARNAAGVYEIPFLDRMGFVFAFCVLGMVVISVLETRNGKATHGLEIDRSMFRTSRGFAVGAMVVLALITTLYTVFW